jgi:hypothetical protein
MMTLAQDRDQFFAATGFDERTYGGRWLSFSLPPLSIHYPMTRGMRAALPRHDLHHVLTGYGVDPGGEAQIAAWELASGCGRNFTAWYGNLAFMALGLVTAPRRTLEAFVRGRSTTNLYADPTPLPALLAEPTAALRERLGLSRPRPSTTLSDVVLGAGTSAVALAAGMAFLVTNAFFTAAHKLTTRTPPRR